MESKKDVYVLSEIKNADWDGDFWNENATNIETYDSLEKAKTGFSTTLLDFYYNNIMVDGGIADVVEDFKDLLPEDMFLSIETTDEYGWYYDENDSNLPMTWCFNGLTSCVLYEYEYDCDTPVAFFLKKVELL